MEAVSDSSKESVSGVAGTPGQVLPEGDHGAREGYPAYTPEPREESQGGKGPSDEQADLNAALEILDGIQEATGVNIAPFLHLSRSPSPLIYPRTDESVQTLNETSALDSEKSGLRYIQDALTKKFEGLQHTLLSLTQGFKKLMSTKRQAQNAHASREGAGLNGP
jgi:hypothetical protein